MRVPFRILLAGFIACCIVRQPASAQSYSPPLSKIVLSNGMHVIFHRDTTMPTVSLNLTYRGGSSRDPKGKSGLASLSGNLLLSTAGKIPPAQFARLQSEAHASSAVLTNVDWTTVYATYDMNHLERALWLEASRMRDGADEITAEMVSAAILRTVEQKRRSRDMPLSTFQEIIYHELYPKGYPYYHVTAGDTTEVKALQLADVKKFLKLYCNPANTSLTIGGRFDITEATNLVRKYFEPIPAGIRAVWDKKKMALPNPGLANVILQDAGELSALYLVFPGAAVVNQDDAVLALIAKLLTGSSSARLVRALTPVSQNVMSVHAYHSGQELDGTFWISVSCKPETNLQTVYDRVMTAIRELAESECSDDELRMARNQYEMEMLSTMETYPGLGGRCDLLNLGNIYTENPSHFFLYTDRQRSVTRFSVMETARKYLSPASVLIVSLVPPGKKHLAVSAK